MFAIVEYLLPRNVLVGAAHGFARFKRGTTINPDNTIVKSCDTLIGSRLAVWP